MRELFIYYRIEPAHGPAALAVVQSAQMRLRKRHAGLVARLLRRSEIDKSHVQTWMETYSFETPAEASAAAPQRLTAAVQADIEAELAALAPWLADARHTEVFTACA